MQVAEYAIEITDFSRRYDAIPAVNDINLTVRTGELFGLIGPDGAGKTTLMRTICTLLAPDSGVIRVHGRDVTRNVAATRMILGYMPQRFSLYQDLTVEQNLRFFADLFQIRGRERRERAERMYRFSRLGPFKKRKASALSGGMKQKLALSCALIHTPQVLVLDEPTFGVDPVSRQEFWEILRSIRDNGTTILVSTAYMDEADQCDRIALMHKGDIKITGTPSEVKGSYRYPLFRLTGRDLHALRSYLAGLDQIHSTQLFGDSTHAAFLRQPTDTDWEQWRRESGDNLHSWTPLDPSIEDVFMEFTESRT